MNMSRKRVFQHDIDAGDDVASGSKPSVKMDVAPVNMLAIDVSTGNVRAARFVKSHDGQDVVRSELAWRGHAL